MREILEDIVAEDKRAGDVIQRLRLMLKKGEVQHQPLDVSELVGEVLKIMRSDLVEPRRRRDGDAAAELPTVTGDRVQLQQVLLNLVVNGSDAMADGASAGDRRLVVRADGTEAGGVRSR